MCHIQSKPCNILEVSPLGQLQSSLFRRLPTEILLRIIEETVGPKGSLNVRIPNDCETSDTHYHEWMNYNMPNKSPQSAFIYEASKPCWTEVSFEDYRGFAALLSFTRTCRKAYGIGIKYLYTHPVFTFDHLETAVAFLGSLCDEHRQLVHEIRLAVPYSTAVPCIVPWLGRYFEGTVYRKVRRLSPETQPRGSRENNNINRPRPFVIADDGVVMPEYHQSEDDDDEMSVTESVFSPLHLQNDDEDIVFDPHVIKLVPLRVSQWSHRHGPKLLDDLLNSLQGLRTLHLEENPSILAPVIIGDCTDDTWEERIDIERKAIRKTFKRVAAKFDAENTDVPFKIRKTVILREYYGGIIVGKWTEEGMDAGSVERYLGGLPVVQDGSWNYW